MLPVYIQQIHRINFTTVPYLNSKEVIYNPLIAVDYITFDHDDPLMSICAI